MTSGHKAIGIIAPQLSGEYFGTLFTAIHAVTRRHDPRLIAIQGSPQEIMRTQLAVEQVDGWIVVNNAEGIELIAQSGLPFVAIGAQAADLEHPAVFPDNYGGMRAAVAHLIDHGHHRIAFAGDLAHNDIKQRYAGYQAALAERGVAFDPALTYSIANISEQSGADFVRRLIEEKIACTAIAAATDENALGVLSAAQAAGYRVPEDLAIVGFDDIILAHSATPPLTTVRLSIRALGSAAAELLLAHIAGEAAPTGVTYVPTALIPRRSCGCSTTILAPATSGAPGAESWRAICARQLAQLARYPLPVDPMTPLSEIWPGGDALLDALDAALQNTEEVSTAALYQAWQQVVALTDSPETLLAILAALEEAGAGQLAAVPADSGARPRLQALFARIRLELFRARLAPETAFLRSYATLVQQTYQISSRLFAAQHGEAQQLGWLAQTPMSWACLGLWDGSDTSDRRRLVVAGSYSADGRGELLAPRGMSYAPSLFPPEALLPALVRQAGAEIAIVLPIKTATHDWGVLALAGPIQYLRSSGNYDAMTAIATLLGEAMERDVLQQNLHAAYERERGLANIVRELGSPVIPLLPEVLLIPLVGAIDSLRAHQIIEAVLQGVTSHQATTILLDISGVPLVDTQVANSLLQTTRAAGLLGARVILIGMRPEIAQSVVGLGIDLQQITTQPTLATALQSLLKERERTRTGHQMPFRVKG